MAICQEDPMSTFSSFCKNSLGSLTLASSHWDWLKLYLSIISKFLQIICWIYTWTEYKDDGLSGLRFGENFFENGWLIFNEFFLHEVLDIVSDCKVHSVCSKASQNNHLLKFVTITFSLPFTWKLCWLWWSWFIWFIPSLPFLWTKCDCISNTLESLWNASLKLCNIVPCLSWNPIKWWFWCLSCSIKNLTSFQEEVPFILINNTFSHLKFDSHLHGKK